ncbi:MAG: hypothetical protein ACKVQB_13555 [Bacteroidia bacterium]
MRQTKSINYFKKRLQYLKFVVIYLQQLTHKLLLMDYNSTKSTEPLVAKDLKILLGALLVNGVFLTALFLLF